MEAQLSLGPPPAMSILAVVPAVADPTEPGRIRLHHASQRRDARRQAEALEARSDLLPSLFNDCRRDNPRRCDRLTHGVALLRGLSTPSLLAQGGQRLPHIFNIGRDISEALAHYGNPEIFNTDQGCQFTSTEFTSVLERCAITISMDGKGRYMDNIFIERLWRSLKYEEVYLHAYTSVVEAKAGIGTWLRFYNEERQHQSLGYRTPRQIYQ